MEQSLEDFTSEVLGFKTSNKSIENVNSIEDDLDVCVKEMTSSSENLKFIDTFNIKLAPHKFDPQMIEDANLTNAFIKFMITRFPKSNYLEKREEYFKKAKINQRIRDELLIF